MHPNYYSDRFYADQTNVKPCGSRSVKQHHHRGDVHVHTHHKEQLTDSLEEDCDGVATTVGPDERTGLGRHLRRHDMLYFTRSRLTAVLRGVMLHAETNNTQNSNNNDRCRQATGPRQPSQVTDDN